MAINDFIIATLNVAPQDIQSCDISKTDDHFIINVVLVDKKPTCPFCGGNVKIHGYRNHTYNHLDIAGHQSVIAWKRRRYACKDCGSTFSEPSPFGTDGSRQSLAVRQKIVLDLKSTHNSFTDIAERFHTSPTTVQMYADSFIRVPRLPLPEWICIDEIHSDMAKYGGSYLCVLSNGFESAPFEILPNRSKYTLSKYFEQIPAAERNNVKYVTIDLWMPYKEVAQKYLKNAIVCADPFHVVKHLVEGFTRLRVDIMNQCIPKSPSYYLLKKWNRLFMITDQSQLDNIPQNNSVFRQKLNYRDLLELSLSISPDLKKAYELMDSYREFNRTATEHDCEEKLNMLIEEFKEANLPCYAGFIGLLENWKQEIINSFKRPDGVHRLSNAIAENVNQRIRELLNVSNGYSNFERFRARVIYCLNDHVFYALTRSLSSPNKRKGKKRGSYKKKAKGINNFPIDDDHEG